MLPSEMMDRQSPDKKLFISAGSDITLTVNQRHVFIPGASDPQTFVRLPNVSEAEHRKFILSCTTVPATTGSAVKVFFNNGGLAALSTTISTTGVELAFESTGLIWQVIRSS